MECAILLPTSAADTDMYRVVKQRWRRPALLAGVAALSVVLIPTREAYALDCTTTTANPTCLVDTNPTATTTLYGDTNDDTLNVVLSGNSTIELHAGTPPAPNTFVQNFEHWTVTGPGTLSIKGQALNFDGSLTIGAASTVNALAINADVGGSSTTDSSNSGNKQTVTNFGKVSSLLTFKNGDDIFTNKAKAIFTGTITLGAGDNTVVNEGEIIGDVQFGGLVGAVEADSEVLTNASSGEITGTVTAGFSNTKIVNYGKLGGIHMGSASKNTTVELYEGSTTGTIIAGAGNDLIDVKTGGESKTVTIEGGIENAATANTVEKIQVSGGGTLHFTSAASSAIKDINLEGSKLLADKDVAFSGTLSGSEGAETIDASGQLGSGGVIDLGGGADSLILRGSARVVATTDMGAGADTVEIAKGVEHTGELRMGDGDDRVAHRGLITGDLFLGAGNDRLELAENDTATSTTAGTISGTLDGGLGTDTVTVALGGIDRTGLGALNFTSIERVEASGSGKLNLTLANNLERLSVDGSTVVLNGGVTTSVDTIIGGANADTVSLGIKLLGNVALGGGADKLSLDSSIANTAILNGGDGVDVLELSKPSDVNVQGKVVDFETINVTATQLTVGGEIRGANAQINMMGTNANIVVADGTIQADVSLGAGGDRLLVSESGSLDGVVDGGADTDVLEYQMKAGQTKSLAATKDVETLELKGQGELRVVRDTTFTTAQMFGSTGTSGSTLSIEQGATLTAPITGSLAADRANIRGALVGDIDLSAGDDALTVAGKMTGNATLGGGADLVTISGTMAGNVNLGSGNDRLFFGANAVVTGNVAGGALDTDTLVVETAAGASRTLDGARFTGFEQLETAGAGELVLASNASFLKTTIGDGALKVAAGATLTGNVEGTTAANTLRLAGRITGSVNLGAGNDRLELSGSGTADGGLSGGDGIDTLAFTISGDTSSLPVADSFESLDVSGAGTLTLALDQSFDTLTLGSGSNLALNPGAKPGHKVARIVGDDGAQAVAINAPLTGGVALGGGNDSLSLALSGTLGQALDGGAGTDTLELQLTGATRLNGGLTGFERVNAKGTAVLTIAGTFGGAGETFNFDDQANTLIVEGTLGSDVNLRGGDDTLLIASTGALAGVVNGGDGHDRLTFDIATDASRLLTDTQVKSFEELVVTGTGTLALSGNSFGFDTITATDGNILLVAGTRLESTALALGKGDNRMTIGTAVTLARPIDGGDGTDTLAFNTDTGETRLLSSVTAKDFEVLETSGRGAFVVDRTVKFDAVSAFGATFTVTEGATLTTKAVTGSDEANALQLLGTLDGSVDLGGGDDTLTVASKMTGNATLGDGADVATISGTLTGRVDLGTGNDLLTIAGQLGGNAVLGAGDDALTVRGGMTGDAALGDGADLAVINGTLTGNIDLGAGNDRLTVAGRLAGNAASGEGADFVTVAGQIEGALDLGTGDDRLEVASSAAVVRGAVAGGAGSDTLAFATSGAYASPTVWNGQGYTGFEVLDNMGGVTSLTGNASFQSVTVTGGRLIGQAGTTLTASGGVAVAQGATFGSAGTVVGNVAVSGTLSPGASPGTMTVNGNVAFASGSNLLLELQPTGQDLLNISGTLTIADGATADITGVLEALPGRELDLVVAQGGITGSFRTINKSSTIFGFVAQTGNRLQLRGEFQNNAGYARNVQASIDYANEVLRAGQMVQAFTGALPRLIDANGVSNVTAFGQLTPEAYASASQIGLENGLAVTDAVRSLSLTTPTQTGFYAFGQGLANWGDLEPQNRVTVGKGDVDTAGALGGIGYGFEDGSRVGAFLGYLDAEQKLGGLGASTEADGLVGGVFADAGFAGFGLHALVAYDQASAETSRTLAAGQSTARGDFDLGTWIADATLDYRTELSGAMVMAPRLGLTYVRTKRDGLTETGGGAFGLSVAERSYETLYGDAAIAVSTTTTLGGMGFAPYGEFGLRHRLEGDQVVATGRFTGLTAGNGLTVEGVSYGRTVGRVATGFGLDVAPNIRLNAGYNYEMGKNDRHSLTGGLSVRF